MDTLHALGCGELFVDLLLIAQVSVGNAVVLGNLCEYRPKLQCFNVDSLDYFCSKQYCLQPLLRMAPKLLNSVEY